MNLSDYRQWVIAAPQGADDALDREERHAEAEDAGSQAKEAVEVCEHADNNVRNCQDKALVHVVIGDEEEAAVVQRIFSLFLEGHGRTPIASALNADHIPPPITDIKKDCAAWTYCDIRRILADPVYRDEGLIDEQTWKHTQAEASRRNGAYGRRPPAASPLRGLITCGVCGDHFTRRERGKSSLWLCKTYLRGSRASCPSSCIREDKLFSIINEAVGGVGDVDNITVCPDGRLVISTSEADFERTWR